MNKRNNLWARLLLLLAAAGAGLLFWKTASGGTLAGCGAGQGCDSLLHGRWASVAGVPVSAVGLVVYLLAFALSFKSGAYLLRSAVSGSIPVAAAWFVAVQVSEGAFCLWCCAVHALASTGAILLLASDWPARGEKKLSPGVAGMAASSIAVAVLALVQLNQKEFVPDETVQKSEIVAVPVKGSTTAKTETGRQIRLLDGDVQFNLGRLPLIGKERAKNFIVALTDYTCSHCRRFHSVLEETQRALGDDYAVVLLPASRNVESREIQRFMLALWSIDPVAHARVDARIRSGTVAAKSRSVLEDIVRTVGGAEFSKRYGSDRAWIEKQIESVKLVQDAHAEKMDRAVLPQVIVGSELLMGAHTDAGYYVKLARKHFEGGEAPGDSATAESTVANSHRNADTPQFHLKSTVVHAGAVAPGARVPVTAEFVNRSGRPTKIGWFSLDPDLSIGDFTREEIRRNMTGSVTVILDVPADFSQGTLTRRVTVNPDGFGDPFSFTVQAGAAASAAVVRSGDPDNQE